MPISVKNRKMLPLFAIPRKRKKKKQNICMHSVKKNLAGPAKIKDKWKDPRDRRLSFRDAFSGLQWSSPMLRSGRRRRFHICARRRCRSRCLTSPRRFGLTTDNVEWYFFSIKKYIRRYSALFPGPSGPLTRSGRLCNSSLRKERLSLSASVSICPRLTLSFPLCFRPRFLIARLAQRWRLKALF